VIGGRFALSATTALQTIQLSAIEGLSLTTVLEQPAMSTFRQTLTPSARFTNRNVCAPGYVSARPLVAPSKRFPFHLVGAALTILAVALFGAWAMHAAQAVAAPLNAALAH
jgi:hypothetical protein